MAKKRRPQPRPKHKKNKALFKKTIGIDYISKVKEYGKILLDKLKDQDKIKAQMSEAIIKVESYFRQYDSIQLLGYFGLYLIGNLKNLEKSYIEQISGVPLELDEESEVIAEYAMNFGLALPNDGKMNPTNEVLYELHKSLRLLKTFYGLIDMPLKEDGDKWIDWVIHSEYISVRGDGYQEHVEEVFREMFFPHSSYFLQQFGFSIEDLYSFLTKIEDRIICKIGSTNEIYGIHKLHERWKEWIKRKYGSLEEENFFNNWQYEKGLWGEFIEENPDVPCSEDKMHLLTYAPDDYKGSDMIFWIYPQNETEFLILDCLSMKFGDNSSFLEGDFKGNILNGQCIFEHPFVKEGNKYFCFTPMIPHRNLFLIAEGLMKRNRTYYDKYFQQNVKDISRDKYVERKVKEIFESFLPTITFFPSVNYRFIDEKGERTAELDLLGISDKATYIIEIKAHELSHKDRVGLTGAKQKFKSSVVDACYQCWRAEKHLKEDNSSRFGGIKINKTKPIFKIVVAFQHYSSLLGNFDYLIDAGIMLEEYRNTFIVSLFDLKIISEFIQSEDELIDYLNVHNEINMKGLKFYDEIELLNGFLHYDLVEKVKKQTKGMIIRYGTNEIDEEYTNDLKLNFDLSQG